MNIIQIRMFRNVLLFLIYGSISNSTTQKENERTSLEISKLFENEHSNGLIHQFELNVINDDDGSFFEVLNEITIDECDKQKLLTAVINSINTTTSLVLLRNDCKEFASELFQTHICWARGKWNDEAIILCGYKNLQLLPKFTQLISLKNERNILLSNIQRQHVFVSSLKPSIFAEASEEIADKKTRQKHRTAQPKRKSKHDKIAAEKSDENESDNETEDNVEEKSTEKSEDHNIHSKKSKDDKVACKYRKSCYNENEATSSDNTVPELRKEETKTINAKEIDENNNIEFTNDDNLDKDQLRLNCKYRYSCYKEQGYVNKLVNENKAKKITKPSILATKPSSLNESPKKYQKIITTKDAASNALRKLEEKERMSGTKPKISRAEKLLLDVKKQQMSKNACKYRKSCYKTGEVPEIEQSQIVQKISSLFPYFENKREEVQKTKNEDFEELTDQERKLFCKYRKSCYNSGNLPELQASQKFQYKEILESGKKEIPIQLRCKYRKSCYKTGVLPIDYDKKEIEDKKKANDFSVHPTTISELKLFCKYRKSCYYKMSEKADEKLLKTDSDYVEDDVSKDENYEENVEDVDNQSSEEQIEDESSDSEQRREIKEEKIIVEKKQKSSKIAEVQTEDNSEKMPKSRKVKTEEFCEKLADDEQFKSTIKDNAPLVKRLKGKQPTKRHTNEELSVDDIIVISNKRHLRKMKKNLDEDENIDFVVNEKEEFKNDENESLLDEEEEQEEVTEEEEVPAEVFEVKDDNDNDDNDDMKSSDDDDDDDNGVSAAKTTLHTKSPDIDSKIVCKYRKSCYSELGFKNEQEDEKDHTKTILYRSAPQQKANSELDWNRIRKGEQLKCKYRKSCYAARTMNEFNNEPTLSHIVIEKNRKPKPNSKSQHNHQSQNTEPLIVHNNIESINTNDLSKEMKHQCKYRHSCYQTVSPGYEYDVTKNQSGEDLMSEKITEDKNRQVFTLPDGTSCSKYRISCQTKMGLPPKERTPIGPNGRKLCRKKKMENEKESSN